MSHHPLHKVSDLLQSADIVFWDFDGVIKDSVTVKSDAFESLFSSYGHSISKKVRCHHEANGGISRFKKIPIYLDWVSEPTDEGTVKAFCDRFSKLVQQAVVDAPWVPGVRQYLMENYTRQRFVLVTATPQEEILKILKEIDLDSCFAQVNGAPKSKAESIKAALKQWRYEPHQAVMLGDSRSDLIAAQVNDLNFLLRTTPLNEALRSQFKVMTFPDFQTLFPHAS